MTAVQIREVVTRLIEAWHWSGGDLRILLVFDAECQPGGFTLAAGR